MKFHVESEKEMTQAWKLAEFAVFGEFLENYAKNLQKQTFLLVFRIEALLFQILREILYNINQISTSLMDPWLWFHDIDQQTLRIFCRESAEIYWADSPGKPVNTVYCIYGVSLQRGIPYLRYTVFAVYHNKYVIDRYLRYNFKSSLGKYFPRFVYICMHRVANYTCVIMQCAWT